MEGIPRDVSDDMPEKDLLYGPPKNKSSKCKWHDFAESDKIPTSKNPIRCRAKGCSYLLIWCPRCTGGQSGLIDVHAHENIQQYEEYIKDHLSYNEYVSMKNDPNYEDTLIEFYKDL